MNTSEMHFQKISQNLKKKKINAYKIFYSEYTKNMEFAIFRGFGTFPEGNILKIILIEVINDLLGVVIVGLGGNEILGVVTVEKKILILSFHYNLLGKSFSLNSSHNTNF